MTNRIFVNGELINIQDPDAVFYMQSIYEDKKAGRPIPALVCDKPHRGEMYLQMRDAAGGVGRQLWAAHKPNQGGSGCSVRIGRSNEGPAHINAKQYTAAALERHGFNVQMEHSTGKNNTRLDVAVVDAPVKLGIEAQFSPLDASSARARTTKSFKAGWTAAWLPGDNHMALRLGHSIPQLRPHTEIAWRDGVPQQGTVHVLSKRKMTMEPCSSRGPFSSCPDTGRGVCGGWHPFFGVADDGFQVLDEVLGELASGATVSLMDRKGIVRLVSDQDRQRYEESTGFSGEYRPASKSSAPISPWRLRDVDCVAVRSLSTDLCTAPSCPQCHDGKLYYPAAIQRGFCGICEFNRRVML